MSNLLLIKHARPLIEPSKPASEWVLAQDSIADCERLGEQIRVYKPERIFSSVESKAIGTSAAIAKFLGIDWDVAPGLHEHERYNEPFTDETSFQKAVERFYAHPNLVVYGDEAADQAYQRFDAALMRILAEDRLETTAIVAHGTVIALWVSRLTGTPAFPLWQRLGLPSCVILDSNREKIIEIIEDVNKGES